MLNDFISYFSQQYISEVIIRMVIFFGIGGVLLLILNNVFKEKFRSIKVQQKDFDSKKIRHDVLWSIFNRLILSSITVAIAFFVLQDKTLLYTDINKFGLLYFFFSIALVVFIHETYFYAIHRLMHTRALMPRVHRLHHVSTDPTPFTGYAFHPLEAVLEFGFLPLIIFVLPMHINALLGWQLILLLFNIYDHLGFEIMPRFWVTNPVTKYINTPTHHNMHHSKFNYNFGLYFNFYDRIFGTQHPQYEKIFLEAKDRWQEVKQS